MARESNTYHERQDRMNSLMLLWLRVLDELGTQVGACTTLSAKYAQRRVESEGLEFLTIVLPSFAKGIEKSLSERQLSRWDDEEYPFRGYSKSYRSDYYPAFLSEFVELIFDSGSGRLLNEPSVDAIFAIRQLSLMMAKINIECSKERVNAAIERFIECEKEIKEHDRLMDAPLMEEFKSMGIRLYGDVLSKMDSDVYHGRIVPKHGPGSTADRLFGNEKYDQAEWPERLERVFPYGDYALPNWRFYYRLDRVDFLEPGRERPVRIITVPKTQKTPRIIAIEPTAMQYMQQGLMIPLVDYLEDDPILNGMIGFTDQVPNQELACRGSFDGSLATLDLSEASDRVSYQHVLALVDRFPHFREAIDATRSRKADVDGKIIRLAKFASMGSALCFPIEAMVFLTIIFLAIQHQENEASMRTHGKPTRLTRKMIKSFSSEVRVYGDDIVVPNRYAQCVARYLELFGYKVNRDKSFWTGEFRESCGKEYFAGEDVSIVRIRSLLPTRRTDVQEIISTVSARNQFYEKGLWHVAQYLDEMVEKILPHYPPVYPTSPILGRHSYLGYNPECMDEHLHVPLVRGYVVSSLSPASNVSGEGALIKCLIKKGDQPFEDKRHLERSGRPDAVRLKLRWAKPY